MLSLNDSFLISARKDKQTNMNNQKFYLQLSGKNAFCFEIFS